MSLFPVENIVTKEIESWKVLADCLKDKKLFLGMQKKMGSKKNVKNRRLLLFYFPMVPRSIEFWCYLYYDSIFVSNTTNYGP